MSEFITYSAGGSKGPDAFEQVIARMPLEQILWPKSSDVAKAIFIILNDTNSTSPKDLYSKIWEIKTEDLRPHILMLLKGFYEGDAEYKISHALFQTLHQWIELKLSHLHTNNDISYLTPEEGMKCLKLTADQQEKFIKSFNQSSRTLAEKTIFIVPVDNKHVDEVMFRIFEEFRSLANPGFYDFIELKNNIPYIEAYIKVVTYKTAPIADFIEKLKHFAANEITHDERVRSQDLNLQKFGITPKDLLDIQNLILCTMMRNDRQFFLDLTERASGTLLSAEMKYVYHPLLSYQYDEAKKQWFFPFLASHMLSTYCAATDQIYHDMFGCYGRVSPQELIDYFINHQPRPTSLIPFTHCNNDFKKKKIHGLAPMILAETMLHDYLHGVIHTAVGFSSIENIVVRWIKLIGEKTRLHITLGDRKVPFTHETYALADFGFQNLFYTENTETRKFHKIFEMLLFSAPHGIITYLIILDITLNNFYIKLTEPMPKLFQLIQENQELIIKTFNELSEKHKDTNIDPFIIAAVCTFAIFNKKNNFSLVHFESDTVKKHSHVLCYYWEKLAKPENTAQLLIGIQSSPTQTCTINTLTDEYLNRSSVLQ